MKSDGEDVGLYFDDNSARDEQREIEAAAAKKAAAKAKEYLNYGQYIEAVQDDGVEEPYHEIKVLIDDNREKFERYIECNEEIEEYEIEKGGIDLDHGDSRTKRKAREQLASCESEIKKREAEKLSIISDLGLTTS